MTSDPKWVRRQCKGQIENWTTDPDYDIEGWSPRFHGQNNCDAFKALLQRI